MIIDNLTKLHQNRLIGSPISASEDYVDSVLLPVLAVILSTDKYTQRQKPTHRDRHIDRQTHTHTYKHTYTKKIPITLPHFMKGKQCANGKGERFNQICRPEQIVLLLVSSLVTFIWE